MMLGINLLNEMSKEDLIKEILNDQEERLKLEKKAELYHIVINLRIARYSKRLYEEAGINQVSGPFGLNTKFTNKEDDPEE